ncbi:hypothetical protein V1264_000425 [Littorina saxatilis]
MGRRKWQNQRNPLPYKNERNYSQTTKDNVLFRKYYSNLGLMPESEVQDFYDRMKEPLPVTFRITGYKSQANELLKIIRTQFFDSLVGASASVKSQNNSTTSSTADGGGGGEKAAVPWGQGAVAFNAGDVPVSKALTMDAIKPPKCLTWYPDQLAWQIDLSRKAVRSQEILSKLHEFLVSETESGNISRQEAVSMIPPLVLDVQPQSRVLDMCAAPGSKTAQLIEYLHKDETGVPEGVVVANDKENKRCYLMVHQVKRLASPCCMIVNHDAAFFPKLRVSMDEEKPEFMLFDRVLADVPCSGDGTMRKNIDIWSKWQPTMGTSLHGLQIKIVKRGLELLEVGGRLVYSTCSMQPVEDEAVMAEMLRRCEGSVELVDVSSMMPGLKTVPGLSKWKMMNKLGNWMDDFESVPQNFKSLFTKSMFSPTAEEAEKFNLNLCHRVLPHHQDTGGFFFAALRKVGNLPWSREARVEKEEALKREQTASEKVTSEGPPTQEKMAVTETTTDKPANSNTDSTAVQRKSEDANATNDNSRKRKGESEEGPQPKKKELKGYREDPFLFMQPGDPVWPPIRDFYGLTDEFPSNQLLYRSEQGAKRSLYFVSKAIRQIVLSNENRVRFINMGVKFVSRSPSPLVPDCEFRITQESMGSLASHLTKRTVSITREDAVTIFREENPFLSKMSQSTQDTLETIVPGSVVFVYKPTESNPQPACTLTFCGWKGKASVRSFVPRFERSHCLRLFGQDLAQIKAEVAKMKKDRQQKFDAAAASAADGDPPPLEDEEEKKPAPLKEEGGGEPMVKAGEDGEKE